MKLNICKIISVITLILLGFTQLLSQTTKYSNEFLTLGVGARALGMSNAVLASTNDVSSGYWNPAGLVYMPSNIQLGLMHSEYMGGIAKYDYAAVAAKIDKKSSISFSYVRFGIDDIPNTIDLIDGEGNIHFNRITSFSATDNAFLLSYSRKTKNEKLSIGGNAKIIYRRLGDFANAWGFGIDLGALYKLNNWNFAVTGKDITSTFNAWSYDLPQNMKDVFAVTGNAIPENTTEITMPRLQLGANKSFVVKKVFTLLPEINFDLTFDGKRNTLIKGDPISIDPRFGFEANYKNIVFFRAGVGNFQEETNNDGEKFKTFQPNMGVGFIINNSLYIDYALTDIGDNSIAVYSNVFSIKININKKKSVETPIL